MSVFGNKLPRPIRCLIMSADKKITDIKRHKNMVISGVPILVKPMVIKATDNPKHKALTPSIFRLCVLPEGHLVTNQPVSITSGTLIQNTQLQEVK